MQTTLNVSRRIGEAALDRAVADALTAGALPGEVAGFDEAARDAAAAFVRAAAAHRDPERPAITLESIGGERGRRLMRLAVVNDDMPFLVDSVAAAVADRGLGVRRLLHPIVGVRRDAGGGLAEILPIGESGERRESIIYMEIERADARERRALVAELEAVLADVRAAVADWPKLQAALRDDVARIPDSEGAALLRWLLDGNMTLLGHAVEPHGSGPRLGILRGDYAPLWSNAVRDAAIAYFARGDEAPLIVKASRDATVHRRAPMDLILLPHRTGERIDGVSIHAGLWTSSALSARPDRVPVLRARLRALEEKFGFDASGHAGKALHHTLSVLPHDVLLGFAPEALEELALTAMSLTDRPRPKLMLIPDRLSSHLFAFAWLPREEMTTGRRVQIGEMIEAAAKAKVGHWSIDLGDGDLALIRYTLDTAPGAPLPDAGPLDRTLAELVRGWVPAVEANLADQAGDTRATRLAISWANAFPMGYRAHYGPDGAARDVLRLNGLENDRQRAARLYRARGDAADQLHLKIYRLGGIVPLSDVVPVLENFGFRVLEETPTALTGGGGYIHEFLLSPADGAPASRPIARADVIEAAIAAVLEGRAENDAFNQLIVAVGLDPRGVVLLRAWFRYLRQTGLAYGLATVVEALRKAPDVARALLDLFAARHDPAAKKAEALADAAERSIDEGLAGVAAIDDDRILRRLRAVIAACLRTNAFTAAGEEALAFKLDSKAVPDLPAPRPWREIWVYCPRVEGIHLRGGPIARGGLRWSDRRDDFRTEILGLMKAQVVKNAVIVPTGAKGGFYPKQLPPPGDRAAWLAEGTESYRVFIRALLSVTDNIVADKIVHPEGVAIRDSEDPYFVVAADKGTASFSDVANAIAVEHGFWLGDAFASGGSQGYDHKAMGITAKGAWISVTRHFAEMGIDVQTDPITVAGCGDMSGDVFGNGMLLSKSIRLVAAFDHRHIFLDPAPDPATGWAERARLFALPASSWADYDAKLISKGGGVFPRSQKQIPLSPEAKATLGVEADVFDPSGLINAILKARVDLLWFGGIGTYIKGEAENHVEVGDPANDAHRINGDQVGAKVIGEGANLSTTQAGRIDYARAGGRINTDFIDNSAGVDCSDNEVNIKIPLNAEMARGKLSFEDRNALLAAMTEDVAGLVLEDNRLQTLALSIAESGGADALPSQLRVIEILEASGRIDRAVEGLADNAALLRRTQDDQGLTRPELAVLLAHAKLALQAAIEAAPLPDDPSLAPILHAAFPPAMVAAHQRAIDAHRLRREIIATKLANTVVNRLGIVTPFELAEEEGVALAQVATAYEAADAIFALAPLWAEIEAARVGEAGRLALIEAAARMVRTHMADILRTSPADALPGDIAAALGPGVRRLDAATETLLKEEARSNAATLREALAATGAATSLVDRLVRLYEMDGAIGTAALAQRLGISEVAATEAYVRLGEALALDWAKAAALRFVSPDPWERLLTAGLARDFEQLRLDFLGRVGGKQPGKAVEAWLAAQAPRIAQFTALIARARTAAAPSAAMLAQIGTQARILLGR